MLSIQHLGVQIRPQVLQRQVTKNAALPVRHRRQGHIASQRRALFRSPRRLHCRLRSRFRTATQGMLFRAYAGNELLTWVRLAQLIGQIQTAHGILSIQYGAVVFRGDFRRRKFVGQRCPTHEQSEYQGTFVMPSLLPNASPISCGRRRRPAPSSAC